MESCTLCEHWSAHKARRLGLITKVVPGLRVDGEYVPNPLVETSRWTDEFGDVVHGEYLAGEARAAGKATLKRGTVDLTRLDEAVDALVGRLAMTFPGCLSKTIASVRKHKLAHWDANKETNRAWLALNMMTEARTGFRAFHEGGRECREADFIALRQRIAEGAVWGPELVDELLEAPHQAACAGASL